ncbi:MAG TPA: hypothetical protein VK661_11910 [Planctomycetota bacterium]|jgi:hypothetical protein|nr:hypothetical protein [Planctomycetota bacterium]
MADQPPAVPPPASPTPVDPREAVKLPAMMLMVAAGIGAAWCILMLLLNILGAGLSAMADEGHGKVLNMLSGGLGIVINLVGLALAGFIVYGAVQMKNLQNHTMALMASIISLVPCLSPCCVVGLPVGIWALVVLSKPEVKAAFAKK